MPAQQEEIHRLMKELESLDYWMMYHVRLTSDDFDTAALEGGRIVIDVAHQ